MYVEDLLLKIRDNLSMFRNKIDSWHTDFIISISSHAENGKSLSSKQLEIFLKLIRKIKNNIVSNGLISEREIEILLSEPTYRKPPYESNVVPREVRYLGDNLLGFRCNVNNTIRDTIRNLCKGAERLGINLETSGLLRPRFEWLYKIWIVPVYSFNINEIINVIKMYKFQMDIVTDSYLKSARNNVSSPSMFTISDDVFIATVYNDIILASWITEIAEGLRL